jgi:hypothetical protein
MALDGLTEFVQFLLGETAASGFAQRSAIELVDKWLQDHGSERTQWFCPRADFGSRLKKLVLEPWRLRQGSYGWCLPAAFLNSMLRRFPDRVAQFGVDLYETGAGKLGTHEISVPSELKAFDLPTYVSGTLADHPLPESRKNKPIMYTHTDWILLAAVQDDSNSLIDFEGPFDDYGAAANTTQGSCQSLFERTGLYAEVTNIGFAAAETAASILGKLKPSDKTDLVLFGKFAYFTTVFKDPFEGLNVHAVALMNQPVDDGGTVKLNFFSWGDEDLVIAVNSPVTGALQLSPVASDFGPAPISNISGAVIARAK